MNLNSAILLVVALPLASAGCGTAPGVDDPNGAPPCDGPSTCGGDPVPESVCRGAAMDVPAGVRRVHDFTARGSLER